MIPSTSPEIIQGSRSWCSTATPVNSHTLSNSKVPSNSLLISLAPSSNRGSNRILRLHNHLLSRITRLSRAGIYSNLRIKLVSNRLRTSRTLLSRLLANRHSQTIANSNLIRPVSSSPSRKHIHLDSTLLASRPSPIMRRSRLLINRHSINLALHRILYPLSQ
jgi:hypothetical protein